jgi:hypothetical protein
MDGRPPDVDTRCEYKQSRTADKSQYPSGYFEQFIRPEMTISLKDSAVECGLDKFGSGWKAEATSCEHGNEI